MQKKKKKTHVTLHRKRMKIKIKKIHNYIFSDLNVVCAVHAEGQSVHAEGQFYMTAAPLPTYSLKYVAPTDPYLTPPSQ